MRVWLWHNGTHEETLAVVKEYVDHPHVYKFHHSLENVKLHDPTNWILEEGNPEVSAGLVDVPDPFGVLKDSLLSVDLSLIVGHSDLLWPSPTLRWHDGPTGSVISQHLEDLDVRHVYIRPRTPRLNGKVERSHRIDDEEF